MLDPVLPLASSLFANSIISEEERTKFKTSSKHFGRVMDGFL